MRWVWISSGTAHLTMIIYLYCTDTSISKLLQLCYYHKTDFTTTSKLPLQTTIDKTALSVPSVDQPLVSSSITSHHHKTALLHQNCISILRWLHSYSGPTCPGFSIRASSRRNSPATPHVFAAYFD